MKTRCVRLAFLAGAAAACAALRADVVPHPLFADHAVLQQGRPIPVWGTADAGEKVTVSLAGVTAETVAANGKWMVRLPALPAGGPHTLTIAGRNRVVRQDILIGEVWICGGQSNMERELGLRAGQKPIIGWEEAAAAANLPTLRHFHVPQKRAFTRQESVDGRWVVATPETVPDFTAVGFFFGRAVLQARGVPVGLIHTSWGGTAAEAWTSAETIRTLPDYAPALAQLEALNAEPDTATARFQRALTEWFATRDAGVRATPAWSAEQVPAAGWTTAQVPVLWESDGLADFNGIVWFRKEFDLPAEAVGAAELLFPAIDDSDTTWINGVPVGATDGYNVPRRYAVPAGVLKAGRNVIAVRVLDTGGGGGIYGAAEGVCLVPARGAPVALAGEWQRRVAATLQDTGWPPVDLRTNTNAPTGLFNAMLAPLQPYGIRGAIWYQGEANNGRPREYRTLFPAMVADWRRGWGQGDFPFLFVQIAPYKEMTPELREAQFLAWQQTPNTAMAVTIDCGDAEDIHPANKRPVGERLALAARALAYGESLEYSGPVFAGSKIEVGKIVLRFTHTTGGLVAPGGVLQGFVIAGADGQWRPGTATIRGDTIEVSSPAVAAPVAVRYAWANVPEGNLFNGAGLPASPFRTDTP